MNKLDRITFDPAVMGGRPCIRGMRVTVGTIVGLVASGHSPDAILKLYPLLGTGGHQASPSVCRLARGGNRSTVIAGMKLLVDMNLSPVWVEFLQAEGIEATH